MSLNDFIGLTQKQLELRRNNHYVWANYLKKWSLDNLNVWHSTKTKKSSYGSVKGVAVERDFYQVQYITNEWRDFILDFSKQSPKELQEKHRSYLNDFLTMQEYKRIYKLNGKKDKKIDDHFNAWKSNAIENLHTAHENDVKEILISLENENLTVLDDVQNMCKFLSFFSHQISRTKPLKNKALSNIKNESIRIMYQKNWWFISYILGMNIGKSFFETRKIDTHCLLINETHEDFITSDSPIINVHDSLNENDLAVPSENQDDYFYAISPKIGYMINKSNRFKQGISYVSIDFVQEMNQKLAFNADQFIISTNEDQLKTYKKFVGKRLQIIKKLNI